MSEKVDENKLIESPPQEDNNGDNEVPIKEEPPVLNQKSNSITEKKTKPTKEDIKSEKFKRIRMYIVLSVFLSVSLLCLIIEDKGFKEDAKKNFDNHKTFTVFLFIIAVIAALALSALVSYFEWMIKTHVFGILFLLILNALNDYCIIYSVHHRLNFGELFCSLLPLVVGSLSMLLITFSISGEDISIIYLYIANAVGFIITFIIVYAFNKGNWNFIFAIATFLVSEFNIYSSQYKIVLFEDSDEKKKKREKKEILIYSQPFELSISAFKFLIFFVSLLIKLIKCCAKCCSDSSKK